MKEQFNVRLDRAVLEQISALCQELRISQADIITLAVRQFAGKELPREGKKNLKKSTKRIDNV